MDNKKVLSIISIVCFFISSLFLFISAVMYGIGLRYVAATVMFFAGVRQLIRYKKEWEDAEF